MIRLVFAAIFVVLFLICSIPIFGIEWLIGKFNPTLRDRSGLHIVQWAFRVVIFIAGTRLIKIGEENLPKEDEGVVYIVNHRSIFDIVYTYPICPGLTGFIAKDALEKVPLLRVWMRRLYCLFLNRSDIRAGVQMVQQAAEYARSGISILIFPEGTRAREAEMLPFKGGSFKIATKSGARIIPIAITNSSAVFEDHLPWIRRSTVVMRIGEPIDPKTLTQEEKRGLPERVQGQILEMLKSNAVVWEEKALPREKKRERSVSNQTFEE